MRPTLVAAVAGLLALAFAGCLDEIEALDGCDADLHARDVALDAPTSGGPGPRSIRLLATDVQGLPMRGAAVAAWWEAGDDGDTMESDEEDDAVRLQTIRLRTGTDGSATVQAPAGRDIHLMAGPDAWIDEGLVKAGDGPASVTLTGPLQSGSVEAAWDAPVAIGVQTRTWDPQEMPWADEDHLARLQSLALVLEWENAPQGSADFGIALGRGGLDRYWNQEYQTSLGRFSESLALSRADLEEHGWTEGDGLRAGPSVSTGAYAAGPISYRLSWTAEFLVEGDPGLLCDRFGGAADLEDVTAPSGSPTARPGTGTMGLGVAQRAG